MFIHTSIAKVALHIKSAIVNLPDSIKRFLSSLRSVRQTNYQCSALNAKHSGGVKQTTADISQYSILESQSNRALLLWKIQKIQIAIDTLRAKCPTSATSDILLLEKKIDQLIGQTGMSDRLVNEYDIQRAKKYVNQDLLQIIKKNYLKSDCVEQFDVAKQAKSGLEKNSQHLLNSLSWDRLQKEFSYADKAFESITVPAQEMKLAGNQIFPVRYKESVGSGNTVETDHAVNLWSSKLTVQKADTGQAVTLFEAVRHGVLSPYGIDKNNLKRQEGARNRAREIVTAVLFSDNQKLQQALNGETVQLRLTSTSLLTPVNIGSFTEKQQLQDQFEAWEWLAQKDPLILTIRDAEGQLKDVKIDLQVIKFNSGVNEFALTLGHGPLTFINGHRYADKYNQQSLVQLLGHDFLEKSSAVVGGGVGEYLGQATDSKNIGLIKQLADEIKEIWVKKLHHQDGGDPYKLARRIVFLSYLIKVIPCYNCKSGKDRTGWLDAEVKMMAAILHHTGKLTPLGQSITQDEQQLLRQISLQSGNLDIQALNTGLPGNMVLKQFPVPFFELSLKKRIGDPATVAALAGFNKLVGS